ncbi:MAG: transcription antitermination protein NusB [Bacteroidales bacterium]|nr:transcription antitermination protein NusB [Bacteroidales bacterium]
MQALFGHIVSEEANPQRAMQLFTKRMNHLNDLGIYQVALLDETAYIASRVNEDVQRKFNPSEEDRDPSQRLVNNAFIAQLSSNEELVKHQKRLKINWNLHVSEFRRFYIRFRATDLYKSYVKAEESNYEVDKQLALELFRALVNDEALKQALLDKDLLWEDDYDQIAQYNFMMLKELDATFDVSSHFPLMNDPENQKDMEAFDFAKKLVVNTLDSMTDNEPLIRRRLDKWELERIPMLDIVILNMAITELKTCPSIPDSVTLDEYVELAKEYSAPDSKSKMFVNGILNKILEDMRHDGMITK